MAENDHPDLNLLSKEQLIDQHQALEKIIQDLRFDRAAIWSLLVDISRRLQISSASIKVAVTSLLDPNIFWDPSAQHEFHQTIEQSVDHVSSLASQISLASRIRVDKLVLKRESHLLQEILSVLEDDICQRLDNFQIKIDFPDEGKPVIVDYQYLMIALQLLFEVVAATPKGGIQLEMTAREFENHWLLDICNIPSSIYQLVCDTAKNISEEFIRTEHIPAERALMIYNAYHILRLQEIELSACEARDGCQILRLAIPAIQQA